MLERFVTFDLMFAVLPENCHEDVHILCQTFFNF